jgi:hypothetical protein
MKRHFSRHIILEKECIPIGMHRFRRCIGLSETVRDGTQGVWLAMPALSAGLAVDGGGIKQRTERWIQSAVEQKTRYEKAGDDHKRDVPPHPGVQGRALSSARGCPSRNTRCRLL